MAPIEWLLFPTAPGYWLYSPAGWGEVVRAEVRLVWPEEPQAEAYFEARLSEGGPWIRTRNLPGHWLGPIPEVKATPKGG